MKDASVVMKEILYDPDLSDLEDEIVKGSTLGTFDSLWGWHGGVWHTTKWLWWENDGFLRWFVGWLPFECWGVGILGISWFLDFYVVHVSLYCGTDFLAYDTEPSPKSCERTNETNNCLVKGHKY